MFYPVCFILLLRCHPRDIAEEMLKLEKPGSFFIRESTSTPGSYAMSVRVPTTIKESGIGNILIKTEANGEYRIPVSLMPIIILP